MSKSKQLFLLALSLTFAWCSAWDNEELEMFDLVEEINKNFYEVLGVEQSARSSEIRKAYRRLSLQLHPDKNKAEDADVQFRQLVAVYEVLKDETRRKQYDQVLENGLPDWRMPVYYYRRVRKMGLIELSLLLFLILSIGHYLVVWSIYLERKFTMEEWFTEIRKKKEKKARKKKTDVGEEMDELFQEELDQLPRPQFRNILPFQCVRLFIHVIVSLPSYCTMTKDYIQEVRERRKQEAEESQQEETEQVEEVVKKVKKRRKVELPEYSPDLYEATNVVVYSPVEEARNDDAKQIFKTGEWTDEELGLLAKAVAKFPGGTLGRWEKVGEMVGRTPAEVIAKSKSLKGSVTTNVNPKIQGLTGLAEKPTTFKGGRLISDDIISTKDSETIIHNSSSVFNSGTVKQKSNQFKLSPAESLSISSQPEKKTSGKLIDVPKTDVSGVDTWTQNQQMILEWALKQHPKGTDQRWEKIAEHIPGKSKDDCVTRFKHLAEMVRRRKEQAS